MMSKWIISLVVISCVMGLSLGATTQLRKKKVLLEGPGYSVFRPFHAGHHDMTTPLLAPPEDWIKFYSGEVENVRALTSFSPSRKDHDLAREMYLETLRRMVLGLSLGDFEISVVPATHVGNAKHSWGPLDESRRDGGMEWPGFAFTMVGNKRLQSIKELLESIIKSNIPGDVAEMGVWRGGSSIFMRGVLRSHHQLHRKSYVCDSFSGLPPSVLREEKNRSWDLTPFLEVSDTVVKRNFEMLGMSDPGVVFVKGFFSATMGPLAKHLPSEAKFSLLRLDGDMYESTVDVLYNLYDRLSIGGYLVMDDWFGFPSKDACTDFFLVHGIQPKIVQVDSLSIYWRKEEEVKIQYWRYEQKKFTP